MAKDKDSDSLIAKPKALKLTIQGGVTVTIHFYFYTGYV